jgi:hypothetical protein
MLPVENAAPTLVGETQAKNETDKLRFTISKEGAYPIQLRLPSSCQRGFLGLRSTRSTSSRFTGFTK